MIETSPNASEYSQKKHTLRRAAAATGLATIGVLGITSSASATENSPAPSISQEVVAPSPTDSETNEVSPTPSDSISASASESISPTPSITPSESLTPNPEPTIIDDSGLLPPPTVVISEPPRIDTPQPTLPETGGNNVAGTAAVALGLGVIGAGMVMTAQPRGKRQ